jgi:hypothetical protein
MIEEILPINYYSELAGILVDSTITSKLITKYFPDLMHFLIEMNYETQLTNLIIKWLLTIFIENMPNEVI